MQAKLSKKFIGSCLLTIQLLTFSTVLCASSGGAIAGGGGDPLSIIAQNFNDPSKLEDVYRLVDSKLSNSVLLPQMQNDIKAELRKLIDTDKFKVLPALILFGNESLSESYPTPETEGEFVSLGGMTKFKSEVVVYLSKRVESYKQQKLANLILHETLHHVLSKGLTEDEVFVNKMAEAILSNKNIEEINNSLNLKGDYRKDYFSSRGLIDMTDIPDRLAHTFKYCNRNSFYAQIYDKDMYADLLEINMGKNIADKSLISVFNAVENQLNTLKYAGSCLDNGLNNIILRYMKASLIQAMKKINPDITIGLEHKKNSNFGCRAKTSFVLGICKPEDTILMKEFLAK